MRRPSPLDPSGDRRAMSHAARERERLLFVPALFPALACGLELIHVSVLLEIRAARYDW